jgi:hypothetical protein
MTELPLHVVPGLGLPDVLQVYEPDIRRGELENVMEPAGQTVVMPPWLLVLPGMVTFPEDGTLKLLELAGTGWLKLEPLIVQFMVDAAAE